jgi:glycerol-1-phosphate dehydrogenase [NAD(P)+]
MKKMENEPLVFIEDGALQRLVDYCQNHRLDDFALVADQNTYAVLGQQVHQMLEEQGWQVKRILLEGDPVLAGDASVFQMLDELPQRPVVCLAVGSGTVTDVVRMTSHRTRNRFISIPTAPSVDGYSSTNAPLVARGFKKSFWAQPPEAIFAHLPTLQAAPQELIASGFGDMLGKFIAAADWNLGRLLWDEDYDREIAEHTNMALQLCLAQADSLCARGAEGIRLLMEGLVESGLSMLRMGNSNPGLRSRTPYFALSRNEITDGDGPHHLHGSSVALASIYVAEIYGKVRHMTQDQVALQLQSARLPDPEEEIKIIQDTFGPLSDQAIAEIHEQLYMGEARYAQLKEMISESLGRHCQLCGQRTRTSSVRHLAAAVGWSNHARRDGHIANRYETRTAQSALPAPPLHSHKMLHYMGMLEELVPA